MGSSVISPENFSFHAQRSAAALKLCSQLSFIKRVTPAYSGQCACVCSLVWISIAWSSHKMVASSVEAAVGSFYSKCETGMTKEATCQMQSLFEWISVPSNRV